MRTFELVLDPKLMVTSDFWAAARSKSWCSSGVSLRVSAKGGFWTALSVIASAAPSISDPILLRG